MPIGNTCASCDKNMATDILCSMIHSFENSHTFGNSDKVRLKQLCWEIEFSVNQGTMRDAFINLTSQ